MENLGKLSAGSPLISAVDEQEGQISKLVDLISQLNDRVYHVSLNQDVTTGATLADGAPQSPHSDTIARILVNTDRIKALQATTMRILANLEV